MLRQWIRHIDIILLWLLVWQLASVVVNNDILLAGPLEIARALLANIQKPSFWLNVASSGARVLIGFLAALAGGLLLGALAWRFKLLAELLNPPMLFIKSVPIVCFVVLVLVWAGAANTAAVAVFLVAFPAVYFACRQGLDSRDLALGELLGLYRLSRPRKLLAYYWPSVLPFMMASGRVAVAMSWKAGVAAELIGMPLNTIGERIYQAKINLSSADVLAWTLVIVALSLLSEKLFFWLLERSGDWFWKLALPRPARRPATPAAAAASTATTPSVASTHAASSSSAPPAGAGAAAHTALAAPTSAPSPAAAVADGLVKSFGDKTVLDGLSFQLAGGGRYILDAPSGEGKTTLLRLLAGLEQPTAGNLAAPKPVSMVFQEPRLFEQRSALENLLLLAGRHHSPEALRGLLGQVLPDTSLSCPVSSLSGGQRRRVELCRALACPSQMLLLDEPFTGLDKDSLKAARQLVLQHQDGRTLIVASHDRADRQALGLERVTVLLGQQVAD